MDKLDIHANLKEPHENTGRANKEHKREYLFMLLNDCLTLFAAQMHPLTTSQSWMPAMDTGQLFFTRNLAYSQPSTAPSEDTASCVFPLALSALKASSRRRWTRS